MKLLPTTTRVNAEDSLGHGLDAVIVLMLFLAMGFGLDRWLGTTPLFMIVMTVLGSIGLFAKFKYRYEQKMDQHEASRLAKLAGPAATRQAGGVDVGAPDPTMATTNTPVTDVRGGIA